MLAKARVVTIMPIRKMDRALRFYTRSLGGKLVERGRGEMRNGWASVRLLGHDFWLIAPPEREKRRLAYTLLLVKDVKRAVRELQKKGAKFQRAERMGPETKVEGPIAFDSYGATAFFKDTEGNLLMLWQNFPPM
jgi:predicted enzyme related to lactoylglutathione lyase